MKVWLSVSLLALLAIAGAGAKFIYEGTHPSDVQVEQRTAPQVAALSQFYTERQREPLADQEPSLHADAAAMKSHGYTWSGSCAYTWSGYQWIKRGCLVRLGRRIYFRDAISPAWYYDLRSGTWWVKLYPSGWMRGDEYYRAWGFYARINSSLHRSACLQAFGRLC